MLKRKDVDVEEKIHDGVWYPLLSYVGSKRGVEDQPYGVSWIPHSLFDFKHNLKVHFEGKMANFYNLGSMFCCSLTIVTLGYCVLLAIEQCFDVKQMADVKLLTQGQARSKLSQC